MHTGVLVLRGDNDLSEIWKGLIEEVPTSLAVGNARTPEGNSFVNCESGTSLDEIMLYLHSRVRNEPYSYAIWGDEAPSITNIPIRGSTVGLWMDGGVAVPNQENDPVKLLTRLNSGAVEDTDSNYTQRVRDRVITKLEVPKWAMTLLYVGVSKPSFILSTKKMQMYLWLIITQTGNYLLVWSTQENLIKNMLDKMDQVKQHNLFHSRFEFDSNSLLTIHPMYLISKFNNNIRKHADTRDRKMSSANYIKNYITRMILPVQFDFP